MIWWAQEVPMPARESMRWNPADELRPLEERMLRRLVRTGRLFRFLRLHRSRLFDEVPCYISIQSPDLRVLEANRKLVENFGGPMGRQCHEVYKGRNEPCPECPVQRTLEDGKEHSSSEVIFYRRGLPHDVVVNTKPLHDREGKIVAVMEMFTDITVQKELEHRLHDSLHRFHHLFDAVPSFISVQDRDFIIIEANDRFKETFGAVGVFRNTYELDFGR